MWIKIFFLNSNKTKKYIETPKNRRKLQKALICKSIEAHPHPALKSQRQFIIATGEWQKRVYSSSSLSSEGGRKKSDCQTGGPLRESRARRRGRIPRGRAPRHLLSFAEEMLWPWYTAKRTQSFYVYIASVERIFYFCIARVFIILTWRGCGREKFCMRHLLPLRVCFEVLKSSKLLFQSWRCCDDRDKRVIIAAK